jgi:YidC/Oxa1 family membrane protein insertase
MNPTELIRYGLLGASARTADADAAMADPLTDVPAGADAAPPTPSPQQADVPATSDLDVPSVDGAPRPEQPAAPDTDGLVRVRSDVLNLWIDRRGGDVVKATLPGYPVSLDQPDVPFTLLDRQRDFVYVAQSGIAGPDGIDRPEGRPRFAVSRSEFELGAGEESLVVPLVYVDERGVTWTKRYTLTRGDYEVKVDYLVDNPTGEPLRYSLYGQIKRSPGDPPGFEAPGMGPRPYVGAAFTTDDSRYEKIDFDDLDDETWQRRVTDGWLAMLQHYFISAWVPASEAEHLYRGRRASDGTYIAEFVGPQQSVGAGEAAQVGASLYLGPKIQDRLEEIAENLNLTVDYGFLWWIAVPLFHLLDLLHSMVDNWGFAIILLTLLVKLALYPLSAASYRSMANMRKVAPDMKRLQERYSDDRQKLSQEMMNLYRKEKINPLGGCLPMLLQMPVFLALYWVLYESVELRQADFILWIDDLSAIDPFFVLPLLMGASMMFQMSLNPPPPDPMQAKIMKIMPVMFTVLFLFFPAGLVLYWLVNNLISIAQQWYITRQIEGGAKKAA